MDEQDIYLALQAQILLAFSIVQLTIYDCRIISIEIFKKNRNYLSETSIQRFFGLLATNEKPSPFLLYNLAVFLGFKPYESFKEQISTSAYNKSDD